MLSEKFQKPDCESNACVEAAYAQHQVQIRNSKQPEFVITFTPAEWTKFLKSVRTSDTFDLPPGV